MMHVPPKQRKQIAKVASAVYAEMDGKPVSGEVKHRMAVAAGMRVLKGMGMPKMMAKRAGNALEGEQREPLDADLEGMSDDERLMVDGATDLAGAAVGVVAKEIEKQTGCFCDARILAAIRALLAVAIQGIHYGIKSKA